MHPKGLLPLLQSALKTPSTTRTTSYAQCHQALEFASLHPWAHNTIVRHQQLSKVADEEAYTTDARIAQVGNSHLRKGD